MSYQDDHCRYMALRRARGSHPVPSISMFYGYVPHSVSGDIRSVTAVTLDMLQASPVVSGSPSRLYAQPVKAVPAGSWLVVVIPAFARLSALKDNGTGVPVPFDEDIGAAGTGANGVRVEMDGADMLVYGELCLASGDRFIYVK